ncbi:MAG: transposase [Alphaproteobacteria bacterium]
MGYSPERKAAVLKRMLPPNSMAIRQLSQQEGISEATLHKWRAKARGKGQLLPDADAGPEGWSSRDKFAAVLEAAALNQVDLTEYSRKRGLYSLRPKSDLNFRWAYDQLKHLDVNNIDDGSPVLSTTRDAFYLQDLLLPPLDE